MDVVNCELIDNMVKNIIDFMEKQAYDCINTYC